MQLTNKIHIFKHQFYIHLSPKNKIPRNVNSLIIFDDEITLVDSGVKGSWESIFEYIKGQGRSPEEISRLILSHSHPDHIGSATEIKKQTGCRILAHQDEKDWFENIELQRKQRPVPGFYELVDQAVTIDDFIEHNQEITIGNEFTAKVLHSPGHSRGSVSLLFVEDKIMFTADSIPVENDIPNYDNYPDLWESLQRIKSNLDVNILLSSWADPIMEIEKMNKMIEEAEKYLKRLDRFVKINYTGGNEKILEHCTNVIKDMNLPEFYINPIVDKAFRTHLF